MIAETRLSSTYENDRDTKQCHISDQDIKEQIKLLMHGATGLLNISVVRAMQAHTGDVTWTGHLLRKSVLNANIIIGQQVQVGRMRWVCRTCCACIKKWV